MAQVKKIDSNVVGLRYVREASIGVLPGSPIWRSLEPNGFNDFGGQLTTAARNPINPGRQRKKGTVVDLEASGGWGQDVTQASMQELLPSFFFSETDLPVAFGGTGEITGVVTLTDDFQAASGLNVFSANDLVFAAGFTEATNNGEHLVTGAIATALTVATNLVDEAPPAGATLEKIGVQSTAGDLDIDTTGSLPAMTSTTLDFTTLNISPGDWIFVGGDLAIEGFLTAVNNGWKRVRSVAANSMTFDKSIAAMATEVNAAQTVRLYVGRSQRNKVGVDIARVTYQFERTLGAPDDAAPASLQSEYIVGSVGSTLAMNFTTASLLTVDLAFLALDAEQFTAAEGLKAGGTRPTLQSEEAFNTSSDVSRIKLSQVVAGDEAPSPLFAFVEEFTLDINNNLTLEKAIGVLGGFDISAGTFTVGGSVTAFFSDIAAVKAVRDNADVTLDIIGVKNNKGFVIDMPLLSLGDGRPTVEQDAAIKIPLTLDAASGSQIDTALDHTLNMNFFQRLPDVADI